MRRDLDRLTERVIIGIGVCESENSLYLCTVDRFANISWFSVLEVFRTLLERNKEDDFYINIDRDILYYFRDEDAKYIPEVTIDVLKKYLTNGEDINVWGIEKTDCDIKIIKSLSEKHWVLLNIYKGRRCAIDYNLGIYDLTTQADYAKYRSECLIYDYGEFPGVPAYREAVKEMQEYLLVYKERCFAMNMPDSEFYTYLSKQPKIINGFLDLVRKHKNIIQASEGVGYLAFNIDREALGVFFCNDLPLTKDYTADVCLYIRNKGIVKSRLGVCYSMFSTFNAEPMRGSHISDLLVCLGAYVVDNDIEYGVKNMYFAKEVKGVYKINQFNDISVIDLRGNNLNFINETAFASCDALRTVYLPETLTKLPSCIFNSCKQLSRIDISNITEIGNYAFGSCKSLTKLNLSDKLTTVGGFAFYDCGFEELIFPDSVVSLSNSVCKFCDRLKRVVLPYNLTKIPVEMFYACSELEEINLPVGLVEIGDNAFYSCKNLKRVNITADAKKVKISRTAFSGCSKDDLPVNLVKWLEEANYKFD